MGRSVTPGLTVGDTIPFDSRNRSARRFQPMKQCGSVLIELIVMIIDIQTVVTVVNLSTVVIDCHQVVYR